MSEKKPLADELLIKIIPQLEEYKFSPTNCTDTHFEIRLNSSIDAIELAGSIEGAVRDGFWVSVDLYRLAAMGRAWARSQGYAIDIIALYRYEEAGYIKVNHVEDSKRYNGLRFDFNKEHTELSAIFAAISAVWERVKNND